GPDPAWLCGPPGPRPAGLGGRRRSSLSDSGDTGIGTYCSEGTATTPLTPLHPGLEDDGVPVLRAPPSPSADRNPPRRWSSLTGLPDGSRRRPDRHGSLDRARALLLRSPGAGPVCRLTRGGGGGGGGGDRSLPSALSSPIRHSSSFPDPLLSSLSSLPGEDTLRTQKWLAEQMEFRPRAEPDGPLPWQHDPRTSQVRRGPGRSLPFNMLVKVKEGLLRQRELEIERQKQQIVQLQARIRENELRAQQESAVSQQTAARPPREEELSRKLAVAEWEVLHVNDFFKHITQKHSEDVHKLEDKIRTRDRYISSLKKKRQREGGLNQERQQRIEILERYLSELPTLHEVHGGAQREEQAQRRAEDLEAAVSRLESSLQDGRAQIQDKDVQIQLQAQREEELEASVHSLQQKVQQCLDDGVRVPMQDLKRLEAENRELRQQRDHNSRQIDRLSSTLTVSLEERSTARLPERSSSEHPPSLAQQQQQQPAGGGSAPLEAGQLLKEMSLCLLDLQALCSILIQRAQGKEPSLALLLGMKGTTSTHTHTHTHTHRGEESGWRFRAVLGWKHQASLTCRAKWM
uniref:Uncharacterized protein n=1 Tax=Salarias fasciatus TaxID=181472 RepID=A0A672FL92_SALFA